MRSPSPAVTLGALIVALVSVLALTLLPYGGNVSLLFHSDAILDAEHAAPAGLVVLDVPSYDGAQYYEMARTMPLMLSAEGRAMMGQNKNRSYAFQRFLLPAAAFILSAGQEPLLPYVFLAINVGALLLSAWIILRWKPTAGLYAAALAFSPAAMVALHFSLAEPLTILLMTAFLTRYVKRDRLDAFDLLLLSLLVLSREINIFFIGFLMLWMFLKRHWRDLTLLLIPTASFAALHGLIFAIFGELPFFLSLGKRTFPFGAILEILGGSLGYNRLTYSSLALFFLFFLPALLWIISLIVRERKISFLQLGSLFFLALMSMMAWYIWGSITSIGRVITPVYPLVLILGASRDTWPARLIAIGCLTVGIAAALGLALTVHPFHIA